MCVCVVEGGGAVCVCVCGGGAGSFSRGVLQNSGMFKGTVVGGIFLLAV